MSESKNRLGILLVLSGPSGSGKTTLARKLRDAGECRFAVSVTTRPPRRGERDGIDYHFVSVEEFKRRSENGELLENALVHGNHYGSPKDEVLNWLRRGEDVLMDIDVQGGAQVRRSGSELVKRCMVSIFITPPTLDELSKRLANRGTESPEVLDRRIEAARREVPEFKHYDYLILSRSPKEDFADVNAILTAERKTVDRWLFRDWLDSFK